ncbi:MULTISPECIES: D-alanyl-D-alanine carboxypeptidase/D-alanyl-D-alanine endopeptidase [Pseudomonas]|uniref:D-alanyl-D-alanine carboxypeptidase/D-alanyl-D-alanine endopeptidase n=1 Tax=Pseudomonas TaxID=286 RepID=UPI0007B38C2F|nr:MULTISPECIES: D-alanyl-D-alanine carboxypeptidase/D-alanyl-D-alanine-endopeptidase [Pseudomonas]AVO57319.1 D-alanyl-D-alanine carboxypeptidase/D-alanyl-D-alanine-endopeptidase [Pseudomonas chlororaphis subsp. piscium]AZC48625.1 D-alanyl-D-alanine carboxypeptidase [Pseudomonas chlororaphis subsp. piscium]AZC55192.1 D-alanyl-D-alanine carboxypeptidase [Pseudomonas chlororaphis subsp. piscium]AZC61512.1 D-alanyl-D-alanine carboxypeptidase [Pseudomonas chlororaphis subsp. piscium]AZC67754.1 D-a
MGSAHRFYTRGLGLFLALSLAACASHPGARYAANLDQVLADPALQGATVSLTVRDAESGAALYQHNPDSRLIPASSLKLLTTAAALDVLGPDYRFATEVLGDGAQQGERLLGNLYLRGSGDPSMQAADYRELAAAVARTGIRQVTGDLVLDDTAFDDQRLGVDWASDDESLYYAAQISALNISPNDDFDAGSVLVSVTAPTMPGAPLAVRVSPENRLMSLRNQGRVGTTDSLQVGREHGSNLLLVSGALPPGQSRRHWVSVWEPTRLVADVFQQALAEQGVTVQGQVRIGQPTAPAARVLASHSSMPLAGLITPLLKLSNNNMSEVLLKAMGRKTANAGTAAAGVAAIEGFLRRQGLSPQGLVQVDGSGLSRRNQISSQSLSDLLLVARKQPWFATWYAALPVAGDAQRMTGGTLRYRLQGTGAVDNLHAKTGSMQGVSSLSGYLRAADGRRLVLVMLSNNYRVDGARIKALEDRVTQVLLQ